MDGWMNGWRDIVNRDKQGGADGWMNEMEFC